MAMDPTLKRLITKAYLNGFGEIHHFNADQMREYLSHPKIKVAKADFQDFQTQQNITIRCYTPFGYQKSDRLPVVIYISASAFVIDRLDTGSDYCSLLANNLEMKIINIAHRLAPEHKFPKFLYDCLDGILWCHQNHEQLNILPNQMSIWGESSGGSIAATCTHLLRDLQNPIIQYQTLFYPMVDLVSHYPSKELYGQGYMLDNTFIAWLDKQGFTPEQDRASPLVSPLLSSNFKDLPPATIITAAYDPLRDEGELYVEKLKNGNVPVAHVRYENMIHGFMRFYDKIETAKVALDFAKKQLQNALESQKH